MNWEKRVRELLLAGGTLALVGCSGTATGGESSDGQGGQGGGGAPCGNANPDPCICGRPQVSTRDAQLCTEKQACEARGGTFVPYPTVSDGSSIPPHCSVGPDAGRSDGGTIDGGTIDGGNAVRDTTDGGAS